MTERLPFHFSLSCIGEGNGNPLQCSCLENPRDGGAWWAAVYGVTQSWTQLKRLSSSSTHMSLPSWNFLLPATHSHPLDYYRALFWVPWVIQQISIGYLFYIWWYACYSLRLSRPLHPPHLLCPLVLYSILEERNIQNQRVGELLPRARHEAERGDCERAGQGEFVVMALFWILTVVLDTGLPSCNRTA